MLVTSVYTQSSQQWYYDCYFSVNFVLKDLAFHESLKKLTLY